MRRVPVLLLALASLCNCAFEPGDDDGRVTADLAQQRPPGEDDATCTVTDSNDDSTVITGTLVVGEGGTFCCTADQSDCVVCDNSIEDNPFVCTVHTAEYADDRFGSVVNPESTTAQSTRGLAELGDACHQGCEDRLRECEEWFRGQGVDPNGSPFCMHDAEDCHDECRAMAEEVAPVAPAIYQAYGAPLPSRHQRSR